MGRYLSTKEGNKMKGTSGAKKTSTKTTTDEEEITSTSVEPTSAEKPVEETKSPAEQVQETATPTGNNPSATENKNPDYTMDDVVSVAETGSLPPVEPKSAYDMYMEEAKNIYNQGVETNNKNAANQAASAGAQYREVNRNVGEINKANGKADTGYAGDTSIDAYNAYRNSVNKSYSDANSANNELYSYYLTKMTELQQAKDTKEATDRQLEQTDRQLALQEQQYQDTKAAETADNIEVLKGENAYDSSGYITSETAERLWKYVKGVYGEDIPDNVMANLNSEKGFAEWLEEYNGQGSGEQGQSSYDLRYEILGIEDSDNWADEYKSKKEKLESLKGTIPEEKYAELESQLEEYNPTSKDAEWSIQGLGTGRANDDVDITINGVTYDLLCGDGVSDDLKGKLNELATGSSSSSPSNEHDSFLGNWYGVDSNKQPGRLVVYDGKMYLYTLKGWKSVTNDNDKVSLQNCINAYLKNAKSRK